MVSSRNKVIVSIIVLVTVFSVTLLSFIFINNLNKEQCDETLREAAVITDSRMNTLVYSYYCSLENLSAMLNEYNSLTDDIVKKNVADMRIGAMRSPVRLYLPDGSAITENGVINDISDYMDFNELVRLGYDTGKFTTNVMKDYFNKEKPVIEQCYVIKKAGEPIGVLSAVVNLLELSDYVSVNAFSGNAGLYIVNRDDGMVFLDTETKRVEPVENYLTRTETGEDDNELIQGVMTGREGNVNIVSKRSGKKRSVYALSCTFENWEILVIVDEDIAYEPSSIIRYILITLTVLELLLFGIYLIWLNRANIKEMNLQRKEAKDYILSLEKQIELQQELDKEKELMRDFHEMIHSGMWHQEFTPDGRIRKTVFSADLRHMLGYEDVNQFPDEIESWAKALHPEDRENALNETKRIFFDEKMKDCTAYDMTFRLQHRDAEYRWYHAMGKITRYEDGMPCEVSGILVDVTAEEENALNQVVLKRNLEIIDVLASEYSSVLYIDMESSRLTPYSMNEEFDSEFGDEIRDGMSFNEALRRYAESYVYEADRDKFIDIGRRDNLSDALRDKKSFSVNFRKKVNGQLQLFEVKFVKVDDEKMPPTGVAIGFANIDREILNKYVMRKLLDDYLSVCIIDVEQDSFQSVKKSSTMERLSENTSSWSEMVRRLSLECSRDTKDVVFEFGNMDNIRRGLKTNDKREYIFKYKPEESGIYYWKRVELQVVERRDGVPLNVIFTINNLDDATSQKETLNLLVAEQNNLLEAQKQQLETQQKALEEALSMAQSASLAKTTFLNNMSHDIRTPMNAIIGYTGLASSHISNTELVAEYLEKIGQSSDHLLSLINDVLDMSRIESGKMNINEKEENLSEILHTLRDIVQPDITAKQLDFYMDSVDVNDEDVLCDKLRLKQVLLNVLSNAIKYTRPGGRVSVRTIEKCVSETGYGLYEFRIQDNGIGMSPEFLQTIYEPFSRMNSTTVSGIQGTGLGMAITRNIVNMMGGNIEITSEEGLGTEVVIDFEFKLMAEHKEPEVIKELEGKRCLVVDDDSNTCRSVSKMLREYGLRSEWCVSGREAVIRSEDAVQLSDNFDVFMVDWVLPDQSGLETVKKIRNIVGAEPPVIVLTAYDWGDVEEDARAAGVNEFVRKPLFPSDLNRVLLKGFGIAREEPKVVENEFDFSGKHILLVEDNPLNLEIAVDILENNGMTVTTAEDGTIAVEVMKNSKPGEFDAILMDVQMPEMNGYEATRRIRAIGNDYTKNIPIIAMTANAFEEDKREALESGMNEHIAKPVRIEVLKETLARFIKN